MHWIEQLPLLLRLAPAAAILAGLVWVVVFLQQNQVDGERQLFQILTEHCVSIVVFFLMAVLFLLPSFVMLFLVGLVFLGLERYQEQLTNLLRSRVDTDTSYL